MTPVLGELAPDLSLRDQHGQTVTLSSFRGEKAVLVVFYPFAFSGVCTGELTGIRDHLGDFETDRSTVLTVSCDPVFALRAQADRDGLFFPMLSDFWPHGEASRAFGVFDEGHGCATRSSFVVDQDGVLRWMVHNEMGKARDLAEQATHLRDAL